MNSGDQQSAKQEIANEKHQESVKEPIDKNSKEASDKEDDADLEQQRKEATTRELAKLFLLIDVVREWKYFSIKDSCSCFNHVCKQCRNHYRPGY